MLFSAGFVFNSVPQKHENTPYFSIQHSNINVNASRFFAAILLNITKHLTLPIRNMRKPEKPWKKKNDAEKTDRRETAGTGRNRPAAESASDKITKLNWLISENLRILSDGLPDDP